MMKVMSLLLAAACFLLDKPKVKLKQRKRAGTRNDTKFAASSWLPALVLSSLIIRSVVLHCSCDLAHATASLPTNEDAASSHQDEEEEVKGEEEEVIGANGNGNAGDPNEGAQLEPVGEPRFEPGQQRIIVGSRWQSEIFLPCTIFGLDKSQTVSWIRKRDALVLTVDQLLLADDSRFQLAQSGPNWTLVLRQPTDADAGFYECQVSSMEPKLSQTLELRMLQSRSRISNLTSLFVKPGEPISLTCTIEAPEEGDFVYWYKNKESIQFDNLKARRLEATSSANKAKAGRARRKVTVIRRGSSSGDDRKGATDDDDEIREKKYSTSELDGATLSRRMEPEESERDLRASTGDTSNIGRREKHKKSQVGRIEFATKSRHNKQRQEEDAEHLHRFTSSLLIKRSQVNDTANYTCWKLPALEPEMKGALRKHIIRKRRRLKQEQEQDAIEKRLKKEKESKHIQDDMTLDQIRDQLSVLETKLLSLRNEKHSLFVQLKQVLNDDNSKRKRQKSVSKSSDLSQTKPIHEDDIGATKCVIVKKEPLQEHQCTSRHFHGLEQNRLVDLSNSNFSLSHNSGPSYIRDANYNPSTSKRAYLFDPCVNGQITPQVASGNEFIEPRQSEQFVPTIIQPQMRNYNHPNNLTNLQGLPHYLMINNNISTQVPLATGFTPQPLDLNAHRLEYMLNHQKQAGIPIANLGSLYTTITPHILSGASASSSLSNIRPHPANTNTLPDQLHINPSSNLAQFVPQVSTIVPYPMVNFLQFTDRHLHQ